MGFIPNYHGLSSLYKCHLYLNFFCGLLFTIEYWQETISCAETGRGRFPVFCFSNESVDHLFFTCPFIHSIWQLLLQLFLQGRLFPTNSLSDFWQTCIKLPLLDLSHWGRLLADFLWVIWTIKNSVIFRATISHFATSLLFYILHLYSFWTGNLVFELVGGSRVGSVLPPPAGTSGTGIPGSSSGPAGGQLGAILLWKHSAVFSNNKFY
jgi:hypothetical protein